jgi:SagB-type dehydrogenase family enzyme
MTMLRVDAALHIHLDVDPPTGRRAMVVDHLVRSTRFELLSADALRALDRARQPIEEDAFVETLVADGLSPKRARTFIADALEHGLLQRCDASKSNSPPLALEAKLLLAKGHQVYLDYASSEAYEAEQALMEAYRDGGPPPPIVKEYPGAPRIAMGDTPLARALRLAFGVTGTLEDPVQGTLLLKNHPSGGARHPIECYVTMNGATYHYLVREHALERIESHAGPLLAHMFPGSTRAAFVTLTAIPARVMWRYREPSSFAVMMLDAGHAAETLRIACAIEGLQCELKTSVDTAALSASLGLDCFEEMALVAAAIGERQ